MQSGKNMGYVAKVADFGLSRTLGDSTYVITKSHTVPVRWYEDLIQYLITYQGVHLKFFHIKFIASLLMFGALEWVCIFQCFDSKWWTALWEMFSDGALPYSEILSNSDVVVAVLGGRR